MPLCPGALAMQPKPPFCPQVAGLKEQLDQEVQQRQQAHLDQAFQTGP